MQSIAFSNLEDDQLDVTSRLYKTYGSYSSDSRHLKRDNLSPYKPNQPRPHSEYLHKAPPSPPLWRC